MSARRTNPALSPLPMVRRWHRPLVLLAAAMAALVVVSIAEMRYDHRVINGADAARFTAALGPALDALAVRA